MARAAKKGKAVDKWKAKKRFEVLAPDYFNNTPIGPIFTKEAESLKGRTVNTTLSKLVNSNQHHIKIKLQIVGTRGFSALTRVKEMELSRAYVSSHTNPGTDTVESVFKVKTSDGQTVRVKTILFTKKKAHSDQKKALRKLVEEMVSASAEKLDYDRFVQEVVFGKIGSLVFNRGKRVVPLGRVEVRKLELLS